MFEPQASLNSLSPLLQPLGSESKYLVTAVISNLQIFAISVPVLILVGADPSTSLFVRSAVIWLNDFAVVTIIFGKFKFIIFGYVHELSNSNNIFIGNTGGLYHIVQTGTGAVNISRAMGEYARRSSVQL